MEEIEHWDAGGELMMGDVSGTWSSSDESVLLVYLRTDH